MRRTDQISSFLLRFTILIFMLPISIRASEATSTAFALAESALPKVSDEYRAVYAEAYAFTDQLEQWKMWNWNMDNHLQAMAQIYSNPSSDALLPPRNKTETELFGRRSGFGFNHVESIETQLVKLILMHQNSNVIPEKYKDVFLGDAYHWLGHIYEDKNKFEVALIAYARSYAHYKKTSIRRSSRIGYLFSNDNLEHASSHLNDCADSITYINQLAWTQRSARQRSCESLF